MKAASPPPTFARTVVHPFLERRTYLGLVYSLLGLPLGTFYFVFLVTGISLGLGLLVTLAGIPVLVLTLAGCRGLAQLERTLSFSLLDASMPRVDAEEEEGTLWHRLLALSRSGRTWRELAYLLIRFPLGAASFSIVVTVLAAGCYYGLVQPFLVAFGVPGSALGGHRVDTIGEALLLVLPGLVLLLLFPTIVNAQARLQRALAVRFLAHLPRATLRRAIVRSLARGEADAFALMSDLEFYFGAGPYLTPTKLEANLIALRDLGLVSSELIGSRERYHLTDEGRKALAGA